MDDVQNALTTATNQLNEGYTKDAYQSLLILTQNALIPLFDVKFINDVITYRPSNHKMLLSVIHTCIQHVENIMEYHTSAAIKNAPPLPPKPSHVNSKPVLPPKPVFNHSTPTSTTSVMLNTQDNPKLTPVITTIYPSSTNHLDSTPMDLSQDYYMKNEPVADGEIDPSHLVPAQASNNDSLTPINTTSVINADHVPHIPIPPLLTTHKKLQAKLDELESSLKEYREQKQALSTKNVTNHSMTESELDEAISKYTPYVAEAKQTLNKVRTLYMSAATISSILHFYPGLIAYQITRIESAIFLAIPSHALLTHSIKNPHPRITASTDFFNYITRIIEHSILLPQEAATRAQHINHWIKVAVKCHELNNYQTLKAIISAFGTPPVKRLRRTWAYIPKKSLSKMDVMIDLMSEANNYEKYREHMGIISTSVLNGKSVNMIQSEHFKRPTVPFLGTFIHDMTYLLAAIQHSSSTHHGSKSIKLSDIYQHIGFHSPRSRSSSLPEQDPRIAKLLLTMQKFQSSPPYERIANSSNAKIINKNSNPIRPTLSQALHRSKSSFGRLGGAIGFGNAGNTESPNDTASVYDVEDECDNEDQQSQVIQYILMRPWVSQNTVDELSLIREPPRSPRHTGTRNSSTAGSHYTSSLMSNNSSLTHIHSGTSSPTLDNFKLENEDHLVQITNSYMYSRDSSNTAPLTSSSTIDDGTGTDDDYDDDMLSRSTSPVIVYPRDTAWVEHSRLMYKETRTVPLVPPRPTNALDKEYRNMFSQQLSKEWPNN